MITWKDIDNLISKLGKAEKRFFKLKASTESRNMDVLIKLFDEIDKGVAGIERLERGGYYTESDAENLYNYILKCLRGFYSESESSLRIKDEIFNLHCLLDKAQYRQCRKMLTSLKRELYESEQYSLLLKVFEIEKRLVIFEKGKQIQLKPALIANEERGILKKKKLLVHYHQLYLQIESLQPQNYKEAEEFLQEPILINQIDVLGLLEQVFVLKCKERLYTLLKKNDDAKKCAVKMRELFVKHTFLYDHFINQLDLDLE